MNKYFKTKHFQQRLSQRGITENVIEMLLNYGIYEGDKIILTKKNCQFLSKVFEQLKKTSDKMAEKGGYAAVTSKDALITAYRLDSFNRFLAKD